VLEFEMFDLGNLSYFLGMEFVSTIGGVFVCIRRISSAYFFCIRRALMPHKRNPDKKATIYGYLDSDSGGDQEDKKSISDYLFMIGAAPISWSSNKQGIIALSSCEA
jgi:hypothetical protein